MTSNCFFKNYIHPQRTNMQLILKIRAKEVAHVLSLRVSIRIRCILLMVAIWKGQCSSETLSLALFFNIAHEQQMDSGFLALCFSIW